jgi:NADH pyrophosphatase NudC (nudix superfamily)
MKLSKIQQQTLEKMKDKKEYNAYGLSVTMNTVYSLHNKGLIVRSNYNDLIWTGWESTCLKFKITKLGLQFLQNPDKYKICPYCRKKVVRKEFEMCKKCQLCQ